METYEIEGVELTRRDLLEIVKAVADGTGRTSPRAWNKAIDLETALLSA